jgi:hypothetical protein
MKSLRKLRSKKNKTRNKRRRGGSVASNPMTKKDIVEMLSYRIQDRLKIIKGTNNVLELYIIIDILNRLSYDELVKIERINSMSEQFNIKLREIGLLD